MLEVVGINSNKDKYVLIVDLVVLVVDCVLCRSVVAVDCVLCRSVVQLFTCDLYLDLALSYLMIHQLQHVHTFSIYCVLTKLVLPWYNSTG